MKSDLFQSCGHCWVFQICWHIECSTFTASSFRIWNRSTGIPSSPLALFVVMLPKAHLTSHSRMSGSRWMITPSWLSGSWRCFFVKFFCVFLPPLLNIFCFCSVQFSCSVVSDSWWPHESQHARPPCPSPTPRVYPNSCLLSRWRPPALSSSVVPLSSCPQSLPASGSFPMNQF